MANSINFLAGTYSQYKNATKDPNALYFITDEKQIYKGSSLVTDDVSVVTALPEVSEAINGKIYIVNDGSKTSEVKYFNGTSFIDVSKTIETISDKTGIVSGETKVVTAGAVADFAKDITDTIGDMTQVKTTAKTVAGAVDELKDAVDKAVEAGEVYLDVAETATAGYLKTYIISQGKNSEGGKIEVGKIDIPKDLVVTAGEVVKNPKGQSAGTYIKLTIANQEVPIYINVADLVDAYTPATGATQVQIAISDTNVISATLVTNAVETANIKDKNVTKAKLEESLQDSIDKADSAVQSVVTGEKNGTIKVDNTEVTVRGINSAAYEEATYFATADLVGVIPEEFESKTIVGLIDEKVAKGLTWGTIS